MYLQLEELNPTAGDPPILDRSEGIPSAAARLGFDADQRKWLSFPAWLGLALEFAGVMKSGLFTPLFHAASPTPQPRRVLDSVAMLADRPVVLAVSS